MLYKWDSIALKQPIVSASARWNPVNFDLVLPHYVEALL